MPIFSRRDSAPPSSGGSPEVSSPAPSPSSAQRRRVTHIAPGTRVQGQLTGPTELLIEGEVDGEIRVEASVMVGNEGVVQGPITAPVVRVGGRVIGNIHAAERLEVTPSGSVEGDVSSPRVIIAEGAFFKGRVEMKGERPEREKERERDRDRDRGSDPRRSKGLEPGASPKPSAEPGTT